MTIEDIAEVAHEVNRSYCKSQGDHTQSSWRNAPGWQKDSAVNGVKFHLQGTRSPEESHANWLKEKVADGWVYGKVKDLELKTHPCCVPYEELPEFQIAKDYIFSSIVSSLVKFLE